MARMVNFLPHGRDKGGLLPWVIAVMMYLFALALLGELALGASVRGWSDDLSRQLIVEIPVAGRGARAEASDKAVALLAKTPGVVSVRLKSKAETDALLEPWLGVGNVSDELPVPALIEVVLAADRPADLGQLRASLAKIVPEALIDDHMHWLGDLKTLARSIGIVGLLILGLVLLATVAIVVFGARARLANYRDTIAIMHMMGAEDWMIAREMQARFMRHGLRGGALGALGALATLLALAGFGHGLGDGLLPSLTLHIELFAALALIPFLGALITLLTTRFTVLSALRSML